MGKIVKHVPTGKVYELCPPEQQTEDLYMKMYPEGGGFLCSVPFDVYCIDFEDFDMDAGLYRPCIVDMEWNGMMFSAWSQGHRWNGWAIPYVEEMELHGIVHMQNLHGSDTTLTMDGDTLVFTDKTGDEPYVERIEPQTIKTTHGDKKVWCLNFGWVFGHVCWYEDIQR